MNKKGYYRLSTSQIIVGSFLGVILLGSILLSLPFSSSDGSFTGYLDALFTATTSTCVTGLVTLTTAEHWSLLGKVIILLLIQIGGIGASTLPIVLFWIMGRRISLGYRKLLGSSFNLDSSGDALQFFKRVIRGIFLVEAVGTLLCLPVFAGEYGIKKGLWVSVFHSVSAFCNAGIDILGEDSLISYKGNVWLNLVTMTLIILGGIGFIVWWDLLRILRRKCHRISLHTKITLCMTGFLILAGALLFFLFEYDNPGTIGNFNMGQKLLSGLFQSVTTRTAGFAAISQGDLTEASVLLTILLMFIGGSSVGTAGGVKTGTVAVVLLSMFSTVQGRQDTVAFGRRIPDSTVKKATVVIALSLLFSITAVFLLLVFENANAADIFFEVFSAIGTTGLSRGLTPSLSGFGKLVIILCMFVGRVGPMSWVMALTAREQNETVRYAEEHITVG